MAGMIALQAAAMGIVLLLFQGAQAQIFKLTDVPMPMGKPYSLEVLYTFYVYKHEDSPLQRPEAPYLKLNSFKTAFMVPVGSGCNLDGKYQGVQLSLIPQRHFWDLINPRKFCDVDSHKLVLQQMEQQPGNEPVWPGHTHSLSGDVDTSDKVDLPATGAFYLVLSNCGTCLNMTVSANVEVRNTYGFLPGNEYFKLSFYGALSVCYALIAVVWIVLVVRWSQQLHSIHHCLTVVLAFGLGEVVLWRFLLSSSNSTGSFKPWLLCVTIMASVLKSGLFYLLIGLISQGWGVTQETMENLSKSKLELFAIVYFPTQYILEGVLSLRHAHRVAPYFMFMCWLPSLVLNCLIFYWIFSSLIEVLESAKGSPQRGLLTILRRLGKTATFMAVMTVVSLIFKILDISPNEPPLSWHGQWFLADGMSDIFFGAIIALIMFIVAPHRNTKQYLYTASVPMEELEGASVIGMPAAAVWADEDGGDILDEDREDNDDAFWTMTHPETKGKRWDEEEEDDKPPSKSQTTSFADQDLLG